VGNSPLERIAVKRAFLAIVIFVAFFARATMLFAQTNEQRALVLVVGEAGEPEYGQRFSEWAGLWKKAADQGGLVTTVIGQDAPSDEDDRARLLKVLTNEIAQPTGELWIVFIGHGTYDGHTAKFNLRGPDISAEELAAALKPCRRPLVVVQCASASGPFLPVLSGPGRVIITATRSGYEDNATHLGGYLADAIANSSADLDKDGQTSLLEAFLMASREVAQYYKDKGLLLSEHALLDDNGDGLGTPPDWFHGLRATKSAAEGKTVDGVRAHQMILVRSENEQKLSPETRARRDTLESKLSALRARKSSLKEDDYYKELDALMVQIARLYETDQPKK
jgi:hypothetical protein